MIRFHIKITSLSLPSKLERNKNTGLLTRPTYKNLILLFLFCLKNFAGLLCQSSQGFLPQSISLKQFLQMITELRYNKGCKK